MMKKIIFFVVCVCILENLILQVSSTVQLDEDEQACMIATEISEDLLVETKEENTVLGGDSKYKEYLACLWKRYGYQDEDGQMNWENIADILEKHYAKGVVEQIIQKCNEIQGKTDGDTVALVLECLDSHAPSHRHVHTFYA